MGAFERVGNAYGSDTLTVEGTATKTGFLGLVLLAAFALTWHYLQTSELMVPWPILIGGSLGGFVVALIICFSPKTAPILSPAYAVLEGGVLAAISYPLDEQYHGIAFQAGSLTIMTLVVMMLAYRTKIIVVNQQFRSVVVGATLAIGCFYLAGFVLSFFGIHLPGMGFDNGWFGIGISGVITVVAALNLALDFDFIERSAGSAPKYMEWYGAFSLLVTLVWLYIEILRLLVRLRRR